MAPRQYHGRMTDPAPGAAARAAPADPHASPVPANGPRLSVDYSDTSPEALLAAPDTLVVLGFGDAAPDHDDPRYLRVPLRQQGRPQFEVWRARAGVRRGRADGIAWASDGSLQFGALEIEEPDGEDIRAAAEAAYRRMLGFISGGEYPHLLRIWNYLDGITLGDGDQERYRRFCVGRAEGLGSFDANRLPAATAIGRVDGRRRLQVYWLAATSPGTPLENPRQISAYRYPRCYGPQPPSFARAMLPPDDSMPLLLSGTAAIVGHESRHADSLATQLDETLANFASLLEQARAHRSSLPGQFGPGTRLKVYVRDAEELEPASRLLAERLGPEVARIVLQGAVCRRELRIEIDGVHDL